MTQDPSLHDEQLEAEIRLVGDLVLAASQCDEHLSDEAIDAVLGLAPTPNGSTGDAAGAATGGDGTGSGGPPASGGGSPAGGDEG
jgi:hypothetical protein